MGSRLLTAFQVRCCVVLLASIISACGPASVQSPPTSMGTLVSTRGTIAVTHGTSFTDADIYLLHMDGSQATRLTTWPGFEAMPSWSPDGKQLAFVGDHDGNWEIYTMHADGTAITRLTHNQTQDGATAWSPDGKTIAYVVDWNDQPTIYLMNTDGSNQRKLASGNWPSWSPTVSI